MFSVGLEAPAVDLRDVLYVESRDAQRREVDQHQTFKSVSGDSTGIKGLLQL